MASGCGACEKQPDGVYLCPGCRDKLVQDLEIIPATVEAIWVSAARMDVGNGSVGSTGHKTATEPVNATAYDVGRTLNVVLSGWADTLGYPEPHAVRAAAVLLAHIREVRAAEWAPDLKRELREVLWQCDTVTDRRPPRVFAGICPMETDDGAECGTPVYVVEGRTEAKCRECKATWDVTDWRERAVTAAGLETGTAVEVSRILSDPARALVFPANKISVWVNRGKLTPVNERERWLASIFNQPVPPKRFQVRKVQRLWERSLIESAARSARLAAAKAAKEAAAAMEEHAA